MAKEIVLDIRKRATVKISLENYIEYVDDYLLNVLGYDLTEFVTQPPKTICHPDMPDIIHETIGGFIHEYKEGIAILKHATKDGNYIWAFTHYYPSFKKDGRFEAFITRRKPIPTRKVNGNQQNLKAIIEKLYKTLKEIENNAGHEMARKYLNGFLEDHNFSSLHDFYMSFFDFKKKELEQFLNIDEKTPFKIIKRYYNPQNL